MSIPFRLSLVAALGLAACTGSPQAPDAAALDDAPAAAPETAAPPETAAALPPALLGTFDVTPDACADPMTMARLTVSPDSLLFYYGYATVEGVTSRGGGYDLAATLVQQEGQVEVVPEPAAYRIEATADGGIRFSNRGTDTPAQTLVRCAVR